MIREAVLTRGWSEARQAYAQSFDSDELDAAQLLMPILGFLPATDERMRSTIDAIADELTEDGLVLRYRNEEGLNADGLTGEEGTFVICCFWLVSALAKAGEIDRAEALFDKLARLRQRPRAAGRGDRHGHRRAAGQLPAGVQPHRPDHRRLGDRQGARSECRDHRAARSPPSWPTRRSSTRSSATRRGCRWSPRSTPTRAPSTSPTRTRSTSRRCRGRASTARPRCRSSAWPWTTPSDVSVVRARRPTRPTGWRADLDGGLLVCEQGTPLPSPPASAAWTGSTGERETVVEQLARACASTRQTTWSRQATGRSGSPTRATATSRASSQSRWSATSSTATTRRPSRPRSSPTLRQAQRDRVLARRARPVRHRQRRQPGAGQLPRRSPAPHQGVRRDAAARASPASGCSLSSRPAFPTG